MPRNCCNEPEVNLSLMSALAVHIEMSSMARNIKGGLSRTTYLDFKIFIAVYLFLFAKDLITHEGS